MIELWPPVIPRTLTRQVWDASTARKIPGVGRALQLYGMVAQCGLLHFRGVDQLAGPLPRLLQRPDPDMALPTYLSVHVEDYLLHGNAAHLVTATGSDGMPAATRWFPASAWSIEADDDNQPKYLLYGREVPRERVVHVQRGAHPAFPFRGVGVIEQHLGAFDKVALQDAAEAANLRDRGMPSVAIIKPNGEADPNADDAVADKWVEKFSGPVPKPAIFPKDTIVTPLSWNPSDQQMTEARKLSLVDVANAFNLDAYWLGAEGASHNYKSPGPMFLTLLRTSLAPVLVVFEDVWSHSWLPYGRFVRVDRTELLRDDLQTMVSTFAAGRTSGLFPDVDEPRRYMGFPPLTDEQRAMAKAAPPPPPPPPAPTDQPTTDPAQQQEVPA